MSGARTRGGQIADGSLTTEDIDDSLEKEFTKSRVTTNDSTPNFLSSKIIAGTNVTINVVGVSGSDQILAISSSASGGGSGIGGTIETNEISYGTSAVSFKSNRAICISIRKQNFRNVIYNYSFLVSSLLERYLFTGGV